MLNRRGGEEEEEEESSTTTTLTETTNANPRRCTREGVEPINMQNYTSWKTVGCLEGFFCGSNNASALPEYCTPTKGCLFARVGGETCSPMGIYEPYLCPPGSYCTYNSRVERSEIARCPPGHFCPVGSIEPLKCEWPALHCANDDPNKQPAENDALILPMAIIMVVDAAVLLGVLLHKLLVLKRARQGKTTKSSWLKRKRKYSYSTLGIDSIPDPGPKSPLESKSCKSPVEDLENPPLSSDSTMTAARRLDRSNTGFDVIMEDGLTMERVMSMGEDHGATDVSDLKLFVKSMSRCLGGTSFGLSFEFENLSFQPKGNPRKILDQVSGYINAGSLWGVMGASGAGKSTFVNVLMGKQAHTGGSVKVNGVPGSISQYKKIIGYVPQDDIVIAELTVRENILHSARIRLPQTWTDTEIQAHVDILISCLQLSHVTDSLVGSTAAPVISGGQRKRVSIGMELAAAPMALFLDEPTSGLDATSAASIMTTLKALSRMGMTVVTIIHQPRQEIWESLDSLLLLGAGRLIYQGPERRVVGYFEKDCGFLFPQHGNPADVVMDIIAGQGHAYKEAAGGTTIQNLIDSWSRREHATELKHQESDEGLKNQLHVVKSTMKKRGARVLSQVYFCAYRSLLQQWRLRTSFFFEMGVGGLAGFLIGLAYSNVHGNNFGGLYKPPYEILSSAVRYGNIPQMALLINVSVGLTASSSGVKVFGEEKLVFWREAAAGHNRFAYYVGKVLSTVPRMVLGNFHFTALFMYLATPRISWGDAFIANLLYFYCIYGLASCVSVVTRREDGPLMATITSLIVGVLNGMSPSLKRVESWHAGWLWRTFPGTWLSEGYFDRNITPWGHIYQIEAASDEVGYRLGKYSQDMLVLLGLGTLYRVVAFLGLRFSHRNKQK